jgi:hypothetical protein
MEINDFSFHDATILEVREYPEHQRLEVLINFPVDWYKNKYEFRKMIFTDVIYYQVSGFPFAGEPAILEIHELNDDNGKKIEIVTNAGKRVIGYSNFELIT